MYVSKGKYLVLDGDILREFKSQNDAIAFANDPSLSVDVECQIHSVYDWTVERMILKKKNESFIYGIRVEAFELNDNDHLTLYFAFNSTAEKNKWIRCIRAATQDDSIEAQELLQRKHLRDEENRREMRKTYEKRRETTKKSKKKKKKKEKESKSKSKWTAHVTEDGRKYMYNEETEESKWEEAAAAEEEPKLKSKWTPHVTEDGRKYMYNEETQESKWEEEEEVEDEEPDETWTEHRSPDGQIYYYNHETEESRWDKPLEKDEIVVEEEESSMERLKRLRAERLKPRAVESEDDTFLSEVAETIREKTAAKEEREQKKKHEEEMEKEKKSAERALKAQAEETQSTWSVHQSKDGKVYYYNHKTKKSKWKKPKELQKAQQILKVSDPKPKPVVGTSQALVVHDESPIVQSFEPHQLIPPSLQTVDLNLCSLCQKTKPAQRCVECQKLYCFPCAAKAHPHGTSHTLSLLSVPFCQICESASATQSCQDCSKLYCDECSSFIHRKAPKDLHHRRPVLAAVEKAPIDMREVLQQVNGLYLSGNLKMEEKSFLKDLFMHGKETFPEEELSSALATQDVPSIQRLIGEIKPTISPASPMMSKQMSRVSIFATESPPYPRCTTCGGWGFNLLEANGKCAHCNRQQLPKCSSCGGFGVDLVQANGKCRNCSQEPKFSSVLWDEESDEEDWDD